MPIVYSSPDSTGSAPTTVAPGVGTTGFTSKGVAFANSSGQLVVNSSFVFDSTAGRLGVPAVQIGSFTSYTTGAMGTTRVVPAMTASTVALSTATQSLGTTSLNQNPLFGFASTAAMTTMVGHLNKLTDDVAALFRLVNATISDLKGS